MKKNTGLMLSEAQGPLKNLLDNLSGKNANYWLINLKKFLRQGSLFLFEDEIPEDYSECSENFREAIKEKVQNWFNIFNKIPAVFEVSKGDKKDKCVLYIQIHTSLKSFMEGENGEDTFTYGILPDGSIYSNIGWHGDSDEVHDKWVHDVPAKTLEEFYAAIVDLSKMYRDAIPLVPAEKQ